MVTNTSRHPNGTFMTTQISNFTCAFMQRSKVRRKLHFPHSLKNTPLNDAEHAWCGKNFYEFLRKFLSIISINTFTNVSENIYEFLRKFLPIFREICTSNSFPGESFGLKFIPNQSEIFRIIPEFVSAPNSFIPI